MSRTCQLVQQLDFESKSAEFLSPFSCDSNEEICFTKDFLSVSRTNTLIAELQRLTLHSFLIKKPSWQSILIRSNHFCSDLIILCQR